VSAPYIFARLVHFLVAILGIGGITAAALLTRRSMGLTAIALRALVRLAMTAMVLMIASGLVLDHVIGGIYHQASWFRLAVIATLAAGAAVGDARRSLARTIAGKLDHDRAMRRAAFALWLAGGLVILVVVLMVCRPLA
jgi:hypothetical protein